MLSPACMWLLSHIFRAEAQTHESGNTNAQKSRNYCARVCEFLRSETHDTQKKVWLQKHLSLNPDVGWAASKTFGEKNNYWWERFLVRCDARPRRKADPCISGSWHSSITRCHLINKTLSSVLLRRPADNGGKSVSCTSEVRDCRASSKRDTVTHKQKNLEALLGGIYKAEEALNCWQRFSDKQQLVPQANVRFLYLWTKKRRGIQPPRRTRS